MVIVVIGILAVVVVPNFSGSGEFRARGFADDVHSAARHAQKLAVASACPVELRIAASGYSLWQRSACSSGGFTVPVQHPSRTNFTSGSTQYAEATPSSTTLTGSSLVFFADGSSDGGSISTGGRSITVIASTGYAQAN